MSWKRVIAVLALTAVALGGTSLTQIRMDNLRERKFDDELLYLPNEKLLNHFTGGMSSVIADFLWLRCIQYTSQHFQSDNKFTWLAEMGNTITRLDPYFVDAYRYTGIFLAGLKADDDASIELMKKGFIENPEAWELPYETSMVYLLNRREEPGSAAIAAHYLGMAVATERAPESVLAIAQGLERKHNLNDVARQIWQDMLANSNDELRKNMAKRKLMELDIRENAAALERIAQEFEKAQGRAPANIDELVTAGYLTQLPPDPLGGRYFLEEGHVENTTLLDDLVQRKLDVVRKQVEKFTRESGRPPKTLEEMVESKVVTSTPSHPYKGRTWKYDPQTGEVSP
ncbi:MAG: hypothetical protein RBU21_12910 [FCB group bacterium]|jgi:hypothetical protein|nr:hypothetical protein [FCB group bacterium]